MPILTKLKEILDEANVSYEIFNHPLAYTSQEIAAAFFLRGSTSRRSWRSITRAVTCRPTPKDRATLSVG
jgi:hypothetical protein